MGVARGVAKEEGVTRGRRRRRGNTIPLMAARVRMPCARALYGFEGQSPYELNFSPGVSIMLLRRVDENWLEGKLEGRVGIFPASHVSIEVGSPSGMLGHFIDS